MAYRPILFVVGLGLALWVISLIIVRQAATASGRTGREAAQMHYWSGTSDGLNLFDGRTWTTYTTTHGLASNTVRAIATNLAGEKWGGTPPGIR